MPCCRGLAQGPALDERPDGCPLPVDRSRATEAAALFPRPCHLRLDPLTYDAPLELRVGHGHVVHHLAEGRRGVQPRLAVAAEPDPPVSQVLERLGRVQHATKARSIRQTRIRSTWRFAALSSSRRQSVRPWTPAEIRRFLLAAPEEWRPVWIVAVFSGLRPGEIQAMRWTEQNWPDFIANKIHVRASYEARSKVLGAPKTDRSVRDVDMVPTVRQVIESLPGREGLVFSRAAGCVFSRDTMYAAWRRTLQEAGVRRIRPYDLRHTFASLLIAAGKNPLYIARQMGHYSAGFTLDTYGHLIEALPKRQTEWIDEIVFPEGFAAALKLHLSGAPQGAATCSPTQPGEARNPLENQENRNVVQSGAAGCVVPPARFELALPA